MQKVEIEYSPAHDLRWLIGILEGVKWDDPPSLYSQGYNRALDFTTELIKKGMMKDETV